MLAASLTVVAVSGLSPLRMFLQETSNGDFSQLTESSVTATQSGPTSFSATISSSAYCSVSGTQSNIQFASLDVTPAVEKLFAANLTSVNVSVQCSRPAFPECFFYRWAPVTGFVDATQTAPNNASWPKPYTAPCISYSSGTLCAQQTFSPQVNLIEGNLTSHAPCDAVALTPLTNATVTSLGGAAIVGVTIPFSSTVCNGGGGGFLSLNCNITVAA